MKKCVGCAEHKNCQESFSSWIFFIIGIIATIAVRVVTVLIHVSPIYAKIAWYVGIAGFFIFFIYKFRVSQARAKVISEHGLADKINHGEKLTRDDYGLIGVILCGLSSKKEMINYMFIFGLSAVAIIAALYMDFVK